MEFKKCKISFNIRYPIVIYVVYKREKVNDMCNMYVQHECSRIHEGARRNWSGLGINYVQQFVQWVG